MAVLIRHRRVVAESWRTLENELGRLLMPGEDGLVPDIPAGDVIVPLKLWRLRREDLIERPGALGLQIGTHVDPCLIAQDLKHFGVIAIVFPQFNDGRGYSLARLLRERHGYRGELRASGDVGRDSLFGLAQCGFDSFLLREGEDADEALSAFDDFSDGYHATAALPLPLFSRRLATV